MIAALFFIVSMMTATQAFAVLRLSYEPPVNDPEIPLCKNLKRTGVCIEPIKDESETAILYRVAWEERGVKYYGEWNSDHQMIKDWVEDGNDRFPQFKYHVDSAVIYGSCVDMWFNKKDMKGCFEGR